MLIARAPLRISFAGGGTDLEAYYARYGGVVVSTTINKYFYVIITKTNDDAMQITSSDFRKFERREPGTTLTFEGELGYLKSILHEFRVTHGLSVFTASEIPPGTGLGSSGTVAVALITALATLCEHRTTKQDIAELASYVEIGKRGRPVGLQDQFAAAFGGLNRIEFTSSGTTVKPLRLRFEVRDRLEKNLLLFYTGASRNAATILAEQRDSAARGDAAVVENLHGIANDAREVWSALEAGEVNRIGEILDRSWQRKKQLASGISNEHIDRLYQLSLEHGAIGGKIAGAGGGGFLLLYCEQEYQAAVTRVLENEGLARLAFHFDDGGAQVLVNSMPDVPGLVFPEGRWTGIGVGSV